jgi:mono/diheme cytochrome c family protein
VLVKSFRAGDRLIETRLFMRHSDGTWGGYTYEWDAAQTDATLLRSGARRDLGGGQTWIFPSEADCLACHTEAAGRALGPETAQLNRTITYPQTGREANELVTLDHIGLFDAPLPELSTLPVLADPTNATLSLEARARSYLHTNCSQCHRPSGPTPSNMDLRYTTALAATNTCNAQPSSGTLGITNARLIAPGNPAASVLVQRMNRRDQHGMPPLGSDRSDTDGVALVTQWVQSLSACP